MFSIHCALCAAFSICLVALADAVTIEASHSALTWRTTFAMLRLVSTAWIVNRLTQVRATKFVTSITIVMSLIALANLCVFPINGQVTEVTRITLPWGEVVSQPVHQAARGWLIPCYAVALSVVVFCIHSGAKLWRRDRSISLLILIASSGGLIIGIIALLTDGMRLPVPYLGILPCFFWVFMIALVLSREYLTRIERLNAREQHFRAIFDHTYQFIGLMTVDGWLIEANRSALRFAGIKDEDVVGKRFWETPWWSHSPELQDRLRRAITMAGQGEFIRFEATHPSRDGTMHWVDFSLKPVRNEAGQVVLLIPEGRDITELKKSEATLQSSEASLRAFINAIPEPAFLLDSEGTVLVSNEALASSLGRRLDDIVGESVYRLLPAELAEQRKLLIEEVVRTGNPAVFEDANGEKHFINHLSPVKTSSGVVNRVAVLALDISKAKKLEEQFRHAQKMQAIGQLAGGVAHDFNNLLTVIVGYGEILLDSMPTHDPLSSAAQAILDAGERATALTRELLAFSRRAIIHPINVDLNFLICDIDNLLRRLIGEDIQLVTNLGSSECWMRVDPAQIGQVLVNLAVNARDAMPQGGTLTISTRHLIQGTHDVALPAHVKPGDYIQMTIADTGCGMTAEVRSHVFEPFFTTKEPGKGTGLGLATVHGIVTQAGGFIDFHSQVAEGTTFEFYFPMVLKSDHPSLAAAGGKVKSTGDETVLVVEDDEHLLNLVQSTLKSHGYQVLVAKNGADARELMANHSDTIDLLVTDVVMPGMSGREVANLVLESQPHVKTLYMSGYTDDAVLRHGVSHQETAFLQKPFTVQRLVRAVRDILDIDSKVTKADGERPV